MENVTVIVFMNQLCLARSARVIGRAQWLRVDAGYSTIRTRFIIISSREEGRRVPEIYTNPISARSSVENVEIRSQLSFAIL